MLLTSFTLVVMYLVSFSSGQSRLFEIYSRCYEPNANEICFGARFNESSLRGQDFSSETSDRSCFRNGGSCDPAVHGVLEQDHVSWLLESNVGYIGYPGNVDFWISRSEKAERYSLNLDYGEELRACTYDHIVNDCVTGSDSIFNGKF